MTLGASEQLKHHPVRNYLETWAVFPRRTQSVGDIVTELARLLRVKIAQLLRF